MEGAKKKLLPVLVSDEDLQSNPRFAQLISILSDKISQDGTSKCLLKELEQAEISLSQARFNWLMSQVPYYELNELLTDFEIRGVEGQLSIEEEQFKDVLSQTLATMEAEYFLPVYSNPTSGSTLFGLISGDMDRHNPVRQLLPAIQQAVLPMLEDRMQKKCEELHDFFTSSPDSERVSDKLLLAKVQTLPRLVEEKQQQLSRDKTRLKEARAKKSDHFLLYYQTLLECLSLMESLIKDYKFQRQAETDRIQVKSLEAQSAAIVLKAKATHLQVISDTYTSDNVKALKVIGKHLDQAIQSTERELASTQQALNAYHQLGQDFKLLVTEYSQLRTEIDNCKWGLRQFLKSEGRTVGGDNDSDDEQRGGQTTDSGAMMSGFNSEITLQGVGCGDSGKAGVDESLQGAVGGADR